MPHLHNDSVDRLFQTILNLGSIEECYAYFEDLWDEYNAGRL